jgi:hypothetical protein
LEQIYSDEYDDSYDAYEPSPDDQVSDLALLIDVCAELVFRVAMNHLLTMIV